MSLKLNLLQSEKDTLNIKSRYAKYKYELLEHIIRTGLGVGVTSGSVYIAFKVYDAVLNCITSNNASHISKVGALAVGCMGVPLWGYVAGFALNTAVNAFLAGKAAFKIIRTPKQPFKFSCEHITP